MSVGLLARWQIVQGGDIISIGGDGRCLIVAAFRSVSGKLFVEPLQRQLLQRNCYTCIWRNRIKDRSAFSLAIQIGFLVLFIRRHTEWQRNNLGCALHVSLSLVIVFEIVFLVSIGRVLKLPRRVEGCATRSFAHLHYPFRYDARNTVLTRPGTILAVAVAA